METKGIPCKYELKKCEGCKKEKIIHSFARVCKDCKKLSRNKAYKERVNPIYREPALAIKPNNEVIKESVNLRTLIKELNLEFDFNLKRASFCGSTSKTDEYNNKKVVYWYHRGIYFMYKKDYSPEVIDYLFMKRVSRRFKSKPNYERDVSEETKKIVAEILTLRNTGKLQVADIAEKVGWTRSRVSHILTSRSYSNLTGISYKRSYNSYGEDGDVLKSKEKTSSKIMNI